jgi:hypothetical protein
MQKMKIYSDGKTTALPHSRIILYVGRTLNGVMRDTKAGEATSAQDIKAF